jgi:siroheme decarboxylase
MAALAKTRSRKDGAAVPLDETDKRLLNLMQGSFPLAARPYAAVARAAEIGEDEALARVSRLVDQRIIREVTPIYDTRALGYASMLVAAKVDPEYPHRAAEIINSHPGVSHNYLRDHEFNLWFTIAVPPNSRLGLEPTVDLLGRLADVESIRLLPALRFFKIGVDLDMKGGRDPAAKKARRAPVAPAPPPEELTADDIAAIRALQGDLRTVAEPFAGPAGRAGLTVAELLDRAHGFQETGQMRRFAAVLYHRSAGFVYNGMGVWKVPDERVDDIGQAMAAFRGVSHCYQRPTYPDWPYSVFTMAHGRSKEECDAILDSIAERTGIGERATLYSSTEYKKVRMLYFTEDFARWEQEHAR